MYNLFLDDVRIPRKVTWITLPMVDWIIVRDYDEFVRTVKMKGIPRRVSFNHDIGPEHYTHDWAGNNIRPGQKTGLDCAVWLAKACRARKVPFPEYYVHSMNPIGADNIRKFIRSYKHNVERKLLESKKV